MSEFEGTARPYNEAKIQGNTDSQSAQESPREGRQNLGQRKSLKALMEEGMSLLKGTDPREIRRLSRPINLHDTPFEKKLRSNMEEIVESIASADTIESMEFLEEMRERNLRENEIKDQTAASLTREQQERFRIAENMIALALLKTRPPSRIRVKTGHKDAFGDSCRTRFTISPTTDLLTLPCNAS
jgi:hypothetical protein